MRPSNTTVLPLEYRYILIINTHKSNSIHQGVLKNEHDKLGRA